MSTTIHGPSPLLMRPGAVPMEANGLVAWHYGDPFAEQRAAARGRDVLYDGWAFGAVEVRGPERVSWLDLLASQDFSTPGGGALDDADGRTTEALWLSPQGRVEHWAAVRVASDSVLLRTGSAAAAAQLTEFLLSRRFRAEVTVTDMTSELAFLGTATGRPKGETHWREVARAEFGQRATSYLDGGHVPAGTWARDAADIAQRRPAHGVDTDERTVPNEIPAWMASAVSMGKGCYCGQETVARIANIGAPPRRLVLLNLDGSADRLPAVGADVLDTAGKTVGRAGRSAQHHEDGPIALAMVKRTVAPGVSLTVDGIDALIDPEDTVPEGPKQVYSRKDFIDLRALRGR